MELKAGIKILELISNGGWLAVGVFLFFLYTRQEKLLNELKEWLKQAHDRICYIEKEYVTRTEFYRDISGWRSDIKALENQVVEVKAGLFFLKGKQNDK